MTREMNTELVTGSLCQSEASFEQKISTGLVLRRGDFDILCVWML